MSTKLASSNGANHQPRQQQNRGDKSVHQVRLPQEDIYYVRQKSSDDYQTMINRWVTKGEPHRYQSCASKPQQHESLPHYKSAALGTF